MINSNDDNIINLPNVTTIGTSAFTDTSKASSIVITLPNKITIEGPVGANVNTITFGYAGINTTPEIIINAADEEKVWGAITTNLYGTNRDAAVAELKDHFEGAITESN